MYIENLKFSLWADFIERDFLDHEFKDLINEGIVNGATSNPAIFKNAILNSLAYKTQIESLRGLDAKAKYEAIAMYDITKAADVLKPLFDKGDDGYVSIEVDPFYCDDADASVAEGKRLFSSINRENVMIKVPATPAGYIAMKELTSVGIPVNATLVFKKEQALSCANAFKEGSAILGKSVNTVISVFVSRVDRALDERLQMKGVDVALTGVYNSADIYARVQETQVDSCRVLFASTGVKDDSLAPHFYIERLLAYNSVNTAPIDTIKAYHSNGAKERALPIASTVIEAHFTKIKNAGINLDEVLDKQIADGLASFKEAFSDILDAL